MTLFDSTSFREKRAALAALGFAALVLLIAAGKKLGLVDYDLAARSANAAIGLVLVVVGNYVPKYAGPLPADRFAGRAFVVTGIAYAALWAFAPIERDLIQLISASMAVAVFALVAASQLHILRRGLVPFQDGGDSARRRGMFLILHALFWVFVIMLADYAFGKASVVWVVMAFTVTSGLLTAWMYGARRRAGPNT